MKYTKNATASNKIRAMALKEYNIGIFNQKRAPNVKSN